MSKNKSKKLIEEVPVSDSKASVSEDPVSDNKAVDNKTVQEITEKYNEQYKDVVKARIRYNDATRALAAAAMKKDNDVEAERLERAMAAISLLELEIDSHERLRYLVSTQQQK